MKKMCTRIKRPVNSAPIIPVSSGFVKKNRGSRSCRGSGKSLLAEGHTVGALIHGGVALMGTYQDAVQGAVVLAVTVMCTLLNGTFNGLVGVTIHSDSSFA